MNIMFRPRSNYGDIDLLSIAVTAGTHTAFLYINELDNDKPYLMHLNGYDRLLNDIPSEDYVWVDLPLTKIQKYNIIDFIEEIFSHYGNEIPYDVASQAFFKPDAHFILKDEFGGFTCSTFVLSVFDSLSHPLINYDTWPITQMNKEDISRWAPMVKTISNYIFKNKRNTYLKRMINLFRGDLRRYRAEEVAAASSKVGYPHSYNNIKSESIEILDTLKKVY